ncbi:hypothetical protein DPMN_104910 [Dreissena polymorpha]|uniref:Uncharacterized protein n=1 Tax=Dreissena polymorpha TaxID=45954 RepID=A0A9D4HAV5_DREPO|nr:hypothetical protein DPMN_104910 [Dreissena polymorpha]
MYMVTFCSMGAAWLLGVSSSVLLGLVAVAAARFMWAASDPSSGGGALPSSATAVLLVVVSLAPNLIFLAFLIHR